MKMFSPPAKDGMSKMGRIGSGVLGDHSSDAPLRSRCYDGTESDRSRYTLSCRCARVLIGAMRGSRRVIET